MDGLHRRYANNESLRFLLRAAFYPPAALAETVTSGFNSYLEALRDHFKSAQESAHPHLSEVARERVVETYMAITDSLLVELIYGNDEGYERRLAALRHVLRMIARTGEC